MTQPNQHEFAQLQRDLRAAQTKIATLESDRDLWMDRARSAWMDRPMAPTLFDEWIAERWPDEDAGEIRRRFDALMAKLGETMWRGVPCFPEVMMPVLAWASALPEQRIETLVMALSEVPDHIREYLWVAKRPAFGEQSVKFMDVIGDNGHGIGKQAIAITPYVKGYNLAPWIAAASPGNVGALLAELDRLRHELEDARKDTERLDFLDQCSQVLNQHYGTSYGWELIINHNVNRLLLGGNLGNIDLHDSKAGHRKLASCRDAIDAKRGHST